MTLKTMLASVATVCLLASCEDVFENGSLQPDGSKPSLTINNPTTNQTITAAQGLQVYITVVDKDEVENINFSVLSEGSEDPLLEFSTTPQNSVVDFDTLVSLNGIAPGAYTLLITAKDKRTNLTESAVPFTVTKGSAN